MPEDDVEKPEPHIEYKENGPFIAIEVENITGADGEAIEARPRRALCRCGGSAKKPFCDGSHMRNGFTGAKAEGRTADKRDTYAGKEITIFDNRAICSHAGICTDTLASVWRMKGEPWIDPDGADAAAIIEVINKCPSGALSYEMKDGGAQADTTPGIQVSKDGPLYVTGLELSVEEWGEGAARGRYALCRCGASKNKPFCDGSHFDIGFKDDGKQGA